MSEMKERYIYIRRRKNDIYIYIYQCLYCVGLWTGGINGALNRYTLNI